MGFHLLHDYQDAVLECLVAHTCHQIKSSQSIIQIIVDLNNGTKGLFYFDGYTGMVDVCESSKFKDLKSREEEAQN
ncbi:19588_t:CDS:2 [Entrophospora sp. SA101]|nr:19588_t:CDS:2 [Entrophospora sp. SA101]